MRKKASEKELIDSYKNILDSEIQRYLDLKILKLLRNLSNLSASDVAQILGCTRQTLTTYENITSTESTRYNKFQYLAIISVYAMIARTTENKYMAKIIDILIYNKYNLSQEQLERIAGLSNCIAMFLENKDFQNADMLMGILQDQIKNKED